MLQCSRLTLIDINLAGPMAPVPCLTAFLCPLCLVHAGSKFSQYNPALKLFVLEETGHCPMDERPDQVHDIMLPFLQQIFAQSQYRTT
jgi:hypothetical protein